MPEFRQNLATKEWVILAPERGKRPSDFNKKLDHQSTLPAVKDDCPFCPGNEARTSSPLLVYEHDGDWQVRAVANKFAALQPNLDTNRVSVGAFLSADGFGIAEVVIEHRRHNLTLALMEVDDVAMVLKAYRERQTEISKNEKINLVTIFRNHGARAGTSLEHPHSQIIATPIVPPHVRYPMEQAILHYDKHGTCVYCDMVDEELRQRKRIIAETEHFVAFCPFAARSPFEARIYPKWHEASYMLISDEKITDLAQLLRDVLAKLYFSVGNPDYNYIIRSSPIGDENTRHQHWYMVIIPKITISAGFEIGSGIYINTISPEDCAQVLREAKTSPK